MTKYLVQILLPTSLEAASGTALEDLKARLVSAFGGVTAYERAPAEGVWAGHDGAEKDEIMIVEVMVDSLDRAWWRECRQKLERELNQDEIVVRAFRIDRL